MAMNPFQQLNMDGIWSDDCIDVITGNKAAIKELEKIDGLFSQYADKTDESSIGWVGLFPNVKIVQI